MHTHIIGGSGFGKSKLIEHLCRTIYPSGFAVIDWHGTLYRALLSFLAFLAPGVPVYLLDPSQENWIAGFNPFLSTGVDPTVQVNRRIAAVLKPWAGDRNDMPTFERMMRMLFTFAVEHQQTLPVASLLLHHRNSGLRTWASKHTSDPYISAQWEFLNELKTPRDWEMRTLSSENRLSRFLGSRAVRRHFGCPASLDIKKVLEEEAILLVNLGYSEHLDREAAKVFAALLLTEFFEAAMMRAGTSQHYYLFLDEFHEYITEDIPAILSQTRKGGLSLYLSHQNLEQLPPSTKGAALALRERYVMGGLPNAHAREIAREMGLDPDQVLGLTKRQAFYGQTLVEVPEVKPALGDADEYASEIMAGCPSGPEVDEHIKQQEEDLLGKVEVKKPVRRLTKSPKSLG